MGALGLVALLLAPQPAPTPPLPAPTTVLQASGQARSGQMAPWFAGWTPDDQVLNRTRLLKATAKGHALVFFATWCKPCERGLSRLTARRAELEAAGVRVVWVAVGQPADVVQPWLASRGLADAPLLLDRFGAVARAFGAQTEAEGRVVTRLPRTALLDAAGVVRLLLADEGPDYVDVLLGGLR
jgi:peroxiredoxin